MFDAGRDSAVTAATRDNAFGPSVQADFPRAEEERDQTPFLAL